MLKREKGGRNLCKGVITLGNSGRRQREYYFVKTPSQKAKNTRKEEVRKQIRAEGKNPNAEITWRVGGERERTRGTKATRRLKKGRRQKRRAKKFPIVGRNRPGQKGGKRLTPGVSARRKKRKSKKKGAGEWEKGKIKKRIAAKKSSLTTQRD